MRERTVGPFIFIKPRTKMDLTLQEDIPPYYSS